MMGFLKPSGEAKAETGFVGTVICVEGDITTSRQGGTELLTIVISDELYLQ